jgi:hypothetical protein
MDISNVSYSSGIPAAVTPETSIPAGGEAGQPSQTLATQVMVSVMKLAMQAEQAISQGVLDMLV